MTAKEYLRQVKYLRSRIRGTESMMNAIDYALYSVKGVDPSAEKVDCHSSRDIADKIIEAERKKEKLDKERQTLQDALDGAEARINALRDTVSRSILIDIYIYGRKRTQVMADLGGMASATYARKKRKAIADFAEQNKEYLATLLYVG